MVNAHETDYEHYKEYSFQARLGISDVLGSDDFVPPPRAWPIVVHLPEWCLHRGAHSGHTASRQPAELELTRRERIPPENMQMVNYEHWNSSYAHETRNYAHCNSTRRNDGCAGWTHPARDELEVAGFWR
jgi:hypothetical protein